MPRGRHRGPPSTAPGVPATGARGGNTRPRRAVRRVRPPDPGRAQGTDLGHPQIDRALAHQLDHPPPTAQLDHDMQIGVARDELAHRAVGGQIPRVGPHGDGKVSRLKPLQQLDLALQLLGLVKDGSGPGQQGLAIGGRRDRGALTVKERDPQRLLQRWILREKAGWDRCCALAARWKVPSRESARAWANCCNLDHDAIKVSDCRKLCIGLMPMPDRHCPPLWSLSMADPGDRLSGTRRKLPINEDTQCTRHPLRKSPCCSPSRRR